MNSKVSGAIANRLANAVLQFFAFEFSKVKKNQEYLKTKDGWINFSIGLTTEDGAVAQSIWFQGGNAKVRNNIDGVDTKLILQDTGVLAQLASLPPNEVLNLMLKNKMASSGNMSYLELFNLLISVLMKDKQVKQMRAQIEEREVSGKAMTDEPDAERTRPPIEFLKAENADPGVKCIKDDPYLSTYSLDDFPRLREYLDKHLSDRPAICTERAVILTDWYRKNGFELKYDGTPWVPELRQGEAFKHLMEKKKPIIRKGDLLAGTTTTKEIGVPIYPDGVGVLIWGELLTVSERMLQPYQPLEDWEIKALNSDVFPYWVNRTFREYVRNKYHEPKCQQLDERWAACFMWKTVALSHTILDYPKLLRLGLAGIIDEVRAELAKPDLPESKQQELEAMILCYEGMISYAHHLAAQARKEAEAETDPERKKELEVIAEAVAHSPEFPARNMDEAVHAIWVHWIGVHMESTNAGCVEPTISGKHIGHTNCMMFNMVAALEMALYNGYHPLMRWHLGPETGEVSEFKTFDEFLEAFFRQLECLADLTCQYNNYLGEAHSVLRPTPLMSAMVDGCIEKGLDVTKGGAKYNSSGTACIGLADIVDSLMAIKSLVYDRKKYTFEELVEAVRNNFEGNEVMRSIILTETPRFGSGSDEAVEVANRVTKFMKDCFWSHLNFRGGHYTTGFWSMSNHVAFGALTGALPSGRLAYEPFTPGLTPEANASKSLLDNIRDVTRLEPTSMNNNIAFNVKVNPSPRDSHEQTVEHVTNYAKAYATMGGMQMQFNVVSSETMRAAMARPEEYKDLMVRISGYNAYFTQLNRDLQLELVRRADYSM